MTTPKLWKNHSAPVPSKTPKVQPHCGDGKVSVRIVVFSRFIKMMFCTSCHLPVEALPISWISKSCQSNTWHSVMTQATGWIFFDFKHDAEENNKTKNGQNHDSVFCRLVLRNSMDDACFLVNAFWFCFLEFRPANTTNKKLNRLDLICMVHGTFVTKHCTVQTQKHVMLWFSHPRNVNHATGSHCTKMAMLKTISLVSCPSGHNTRRSTRATLFQCPPWNMWFLNPLANVDSQACGPLYQISTR